MVFASLISLLAGCGAPPAAVSGTAGGITFEASTSAFFGGPYVVIANGEVDCVDLAWIRRSYEDGVAPTDSSVQLLQFAFNGDSSPTVAEGRVAVGVAANVSATLVKVAGDTPTFSRAEGGFLDIDTVEAESEAVGSFEGLAFEDGTLSGTFTATWCRNLRN